MEIQEFLKIAAALQKHDVEYVLVGAVAMALQGIVRATGDIDLFIRPDPVNVRRLKEALRSVFDDPEIEGITEQDLAGEYPVVRYGPPSCDYVIDILSRLGEALGFDDIVAEERSLEGVRVRVATPLTLYRMKRGTIRSQDRVDAELLREKFHIEEE
ncbi:MAG: nucleotidyl transferase AbiEii/AbiGii toxin family protein [Candidatus Eremiobacteraeota bacterium]|nr:nucleotidyl transferase AbiEii/AbiGii toxin family protein [Candidatus Eremiobacteraeota bacterium]